MYPTQESNSFPHQVFNPNLLDWVFVFHWYTIFLPDIMSALNVATMHPELGEVSLLSCPSDKAAPFWFHPHVADHLSYHTKLQRIIQAAENV